MALTNAFILRREKASFSLFGTIILGIVGINVMMMPPQLTQLLSSLGIHVNQSNVDIPDYDTIHLIGVVMALAVGFLQTAS
jgi:drug/metabolite transporter (DMT)-like permease